MHSIRAKPILLSAATLALASGCYLSHLRAVDDDAGGPRTDAGPPDAGRRDAARPPPIDAGPDLPPEPPPPGARVVQLAAGGDHVCARTDDGALYCWGDNSVGQAGAGSRATESAPSRVRGLPPISAVDTIHSHTCALDFEGRVWCFGFNAYSQLGTTESPAPDCGAAECSRRPLRVITPPAEAIFAGHHGTCARLRGGAIQCWGDDSAVRATPTAALADAGRVDFGHLHGCAHRADRSVLCFGESDFGRLGDGDRSDGVVDLAGVVALEVGADHACALDDEDRVFCWGYDWSGSLGRPKVELPYCVHGDTGGECAEDPLRPSGSPLAQALSVGAHRTCILTREGRVSCWGAWTVNGGVVYCGGAAGECDHVATPVEGLVEPIAIETGSSVSCALQANGQVYCWGWNGRGQLGDGTIEDVIRGPVRVVGFGD